ncbi:Type 1 glutamine amidotransferase-like domain-containing protein [Candidatus Woesearchaeota archaeon]|nr:Type 1 glutamine amidotransferase-like domain-containing protein [Candidatus Woesearchaeota archaeon]
MISPPAPKNCVLIGGQLSIGCTPTIDDYVMDLARARSSGKVRALHIGTANGDAQKDEVEFNATYGSRLGCDVSHARFVTDPKNFKNFSLEDFDIIYMSGGNPYAFKVLGPVEWFREQLRRAYDSGVVIVGNSAGALILGNCWSNPHNVRPESSRVFRAFNVIENASFFAHFEDYAGLFVDDGKELPSEEFLKRMHELLKKKACVGNSDFYSFGLWENSALAVSWSLDSDGSEKCTARSVGTREIMYMNGKPSPEYVKRIC